MYFLSLCLFFFSVLLALTHSRSSSPYTSGLHFFSSPLPKWPNGLSLYYFIFSFISLFTLFTSSHIKCKPTYLDFASTNFFSSALPYPTRMTLAFCFFLFFLPSACPTHLSQPTMLTFVHHEEKLRNKIGRAHV